MNIIIDTMQHRDVDGTERVLRMKVRCWSIGTVEIVIHERKKFLWFIPYWWTVWTRKPFRNQRSDWEIMTPAEQQRYYDKEWELYLKHLRDWS